MREQRKREGGGERKEKGREGKRKKEKERERERKRSGTEHHLIQERTNRTEKLHPEFPSHRAWVGWGEVGAALRLLGFK